MSTPRFALPPRLIRSVSLVSLIAIAIAIVGGVSYSTFSKPPANLAATLTAKTFPDPARDSPASQAKGQQTLVLAGGCFWGVEAVFEHLKGVSNVVSGYAGGSAKTANYEAVGTGQTGHAESVQITYDPAQISYGQLLKVYFAVAHDPTQLNQQYPDSGTQYRSAIFYNNAEQKQVAESYISQLNQAHVFSQPIVTQLTPLTGFYAAESYHQNFMDHNPNYPYIVRYDLPKLTQLKQNFSTLYKN